MIKILGILFGLVLISSCNSLPNKNSKNTPDITKEEMCALKVSGIEFSKSLNGAISNVSIEGDKLVIKSGAKSDYFNDPGGESVIGTAPVLLSKIDNTKPFTFVAKVTPSFKDTYDAGAMYIYLNPDLWFKFAFERDERMKTRIVTVRTIETSDDNNHDVIDNSGVYLKISSDVKTIGFYYSTDKQKWQLVRLFKNNYPVKLWAGLSAQSPIGNGTIVTFEECSLTQSSINDFRMGD